MNATKALAIAPCDDGVLDPRFRRVFTTGLSPRGQAEALDDYVDGHARRALPARTPRGKRVARLLEVESGGAATVSPDEIVRVHAPRGTPDGTLFGAVGLILAAPLTSAATRIAADLTRARAPAPAGGC